jgi:hypothetical protein
VEKQQLLSENWVNKAHQPSTSNKDYGYVVDKYY